MKKVFISMVLIIVLMATGCTKGKETQQEQVESKVVYCSDCGNESKEVTKFCPQCGVEAKWVAQKEESKEDKSEKTTAKKDTKGQCYFCQRYVPKDTLAKIKGLAICDECNSIDEKTCYNGFEDICEGCIDCQRINFTVEQAISMSEDYYGIKNHQNDFISANSEAQYDGRGMYYQMWAKSKEMIEQGGNGIVFSFRIYEDGTIIEN